MERPTPHLHPPAPRPLPGLHPESESFAAALAAQKHAHAQAAAAAAARNELLQSRRNSLSDARDILRIIIDGASRQIAAIEAARFALFCCLDSAVNGVEAGVALVESKRFVPVVTPAHE